VAKEQTDAAMRDAVRAARVRRFGRVASDGAAGYGSQVRTTKTSSATLPDPLAVGPPRVRACQLSG
jgi:hypothetical protein